MSTCMRCGSPNFVLNRDSGEQICGNCGQENYVGSPQDYTPLPEYNFNKKTHEMERVEFFNNTNFQNPDD